MSHHFTFRKSSYSATRNDCVEVADIPAGAAVRDSQHPHAGSLAFPSAEWRAFLVEVKAGRM